MYGHAKITAAFVMASRHCESAEQRRGVARAAGAMADAMGICSAGRALFLNACKCDARRADLAKLEGAK